MCRSLQGVRHSDALLCHPIVCGGGASRDTRGIWICSVAVTPRQSPAGDMGVNAVTDSPPPVLHRLNQASLQRCQEEMSKLDAEVYKEAEEKALLREALERTQLQLSQEKRLLRAAKLQKVRTREQASTAREDIWSTTSPSI